ncbi:amino acid permease, partial [Pseudomonas syringae]
SCVYSNSRMLFGLANQGNAPKSLLKVSARGVPLAALGVSATATGVCVLINYVMPAKALEILMALVVAALVLNWIMITITHLKFRSALRASGQVSSYKSWGYPITNYICLAFLAGILVIMAMTPGINESVLLIPIWLAVLAVAYRSKLRRAGR